MFYNSDKNQSLFVNTILSFILLFISFVMSEDPCGILAIILFILLPLLIVTGFNHFHFLSVLYFS
ncbi:BC10 family protein [Tissierella pigra]|nr:BC10 family protein [Tissierella pigra]